MPRHKLTSLIAAAGLLIPSASYAADYPWLTFHLDDNTEVAVASENLTITYADGTLRLMSPTVDRSFPVAYRLQAGYAGNVDTDNLFGIGSVLLYLWDSIPFGFSL